MPIFSSSRLAGKTALITGASSGIGAETAILLARAGTNLILTARREDQLKDVAALALAANKEGGTGKGGHVAIVVLDMQDRVAVGNVLEKIPELLRKVDILVNNAGMVYGTEKVGEISEGDIDAMFNTNVLGLFTLTQLMVRQFKKEKSGHIINVGSIAGREAYAGGAVYCATKHAVRAFSGSLMRELVGTKIRVSEVQPGMVETNFSIVRFRQDREAAKQVYEGVQPLVAFDVAEEIAWIASRPDHVVVAELFILPKAQASPAIVHRGPLDDDEGPPATVRFGYVEDIRSLTGVIRAILATCQDYFQAILTTYNHTYFIERHLLEIHP